MKNKILDRIYKVEIGQKAPDVEYNQEFDIYKFKDFGYLQLLYATKKKAKKNMWTWHGFITCDELKQRIGEEQFAQFLKGKREFKKKGGTNE